MGGGGGVLTIWPTTAAKKFMENTITISAWLTFDQLSCNFENIGEGVTPPAPHQHIPGIVDKQEGTCMTETWQALEKLKTGQEGLT